MASKENTNAAPTPRRRGNPDKIKGQGFHTHPERINKNGPPRKLPDLDKLMADILGAPEGEERKSKAHAILDSLFKQAQKGNTRAAEILLDRGYGKPKEKLEITGQVKTIQIVASSKRRGDTGDSGQ